MRFALVLTACIATGCGGPPAPGGAARPEAEKPTDPRTIRLSVAALEPRPSEVLWAIDFRPGATPEACRRRSGHSSPSADGVVLVPRPEDGEFSDYTHLWAWAHVQGKWWVVFDGVLQEYDEDLAAAMDTSEARPRIRLRILDGDGRPISNAVARLVMHPESGPDPTLPAFRTDERGVIDTGELTFGGYGADIAAPGFLPARRVCSSYSDRAPDDIVLNRARTAIVEVLDEEGRPVADVDLRYQYREPDQPQHSEWAAVPVAGSTFVLLLPEDREAYLRAQAPGFEDRGSIEAPVDRARVELRLRRAKDGR